MSFNPQNALISYRQADFQDFQQEQQTLEDRKTKAQITFIYNANKHTLERWIDSMEVSQVAPGYRDILESELIDWREYVLTNVHDPMQDLNMIAEILQRQFDLVDRVTIQQTGDKNIYVMYLHNKVDKK